MDDVSHLFSIYRECVRHLWNTYFRPLAEPTRNWDVRDKFDTVARGIFSSLVLSPLSASNYELSREAHINPLALPGFRIVPNIEHGTPILINRDLPRSGYWDYPVSEVRPADVKLHLLRFFDFDQLGYRDYRYFEVMIHSSPTYPKIIGRAALIEFAHAKVLFDRKAK
jgi:hypothetical protein